MELEHDFTVPVPVDQAWPVLLDVERIAPCMPGATLDSVDGDDFTGRLKVKLGAMTITYRGTARIASRDDESHTVTIGGSGKESRGSGTASATVQAQLHDEGGQTRVTVHTKLNVTGRPAQFGRNILSEVGGKLVGRFAGNLAEELSRDESAGAAPPAGSAGTTASAGTSTTGASTTSASGGSAAGRASDLEPAAESAEAEAEAGGPAAPDTADPKAGITDRTARAPETTETLDVSQAPEAPGSETTTSGTAEQGRAGHGPGGQGDAAQAPGSAGRSADRSTDSSRRPRPSAEAIDLLEVAGPSIAKRLGPLLAAVVLLWLLRRLVRRARA